MKNFQLLLFILLLILVSCEERFNGKDEESIKISIEKIIKKLNQIERANLSKALDILTFEAYRLEGGKLNKYKGKSSKDISFEMIDGLTYSAVLNLADVILKNNNKRDIKESTKIIDSLSLKKTKLVTISNQLNLFKISSVKIVEFVFMDKLTPKLEVEMEYTGKNKLVGKKSIMYLVDTKYQYIRMEYNYERDLECGDILKGSVILTLKGEDYPKKFPVENPIFSDYGGEFNVSVKSLVIDGKTVEMPDGNILKIETEIERNIEKLKGLKNEK